MFCTRCGTEVADEAKFCPSCGLDLSSTTPMAAVQAEEQESEIDVVRDALKDEYEVIKELGRGGMAIVYRAREKTLDREVALKVLPFSLAFDAEFVERFQREARTAAKLEHPHIIPIYRVGKSGRVIYFVMKFLRGQVLSDIIEQRGALPPAEIKKLLAQTMGALGYAHKNGVVHRDIKPDNIMYDESGNAIVTDFGIAKAASGTRLTGTGMSIGTPHYMSPEQARAQPLDGRSDIYSLGVVAYQCLTGHVPFDGEDAFSIGYKHIMEELPTPELQTAEQRELFEVVRKMMAKSADERFQNAEELIAVLEGRAPVGAPPTAATAAADAPTTVMPSADLQTTTPQAVGVTPATPTTPMPRTQPAQEPPKKKRRGGVLVGAFLFLLAGGGGGGYWYFWMGPGREMNPLLQQSGVTQASPPPPAGGTPVAPPDSQVVVVGDSGEAPDTVTQVAEGAEEPEAGGEAAPTEPVQPPPPNYGWIRLRGVPRTGATVTIDGARRTGSVVRVPPGSRRVEVARTGYNTFTRTVNVARGDTVDVGVTLSREVAAPPTERATPRAQPTQPESRDYCSQWGPEYNTGNACYDTPPQVRGRAALVSIPGTRIPSRPVLLVHVAADGKVIEISRQQDSDVPTCTIRALQFARDSLEYAPARKGTQPVPGWFRLTVICRPTG